MHATHPKSEVLCTFFCLVKYDVYDVDVQSD